MPHLRKLSLSEQCANLLREGISQGRWGGQIPGVIRLAQELDLSTHTLRAALRTMESEGLIALSEDGRSRHVTKKAAAAGRKQRIGILLFESMAEESAQSAQSQFTLHRALESAGFLPFFATPTIQASLKRSRGQIQDYVLKTPADGWIVSCGSSDLLDWFSQQTFPSIALCGRRDGLALASVGPDKIPAIIQATRELIQLGHQRIVLLCRRVRRLPVPGKLEKAFLNELANHGLPVSSFNLPDWDETAAGLQTCLESLFQFTPPTAMFVDELQPLLATQQFLAVRRIRVPEQVSLIANDSDTSFALCQPAITHISWQSEPVIRRLLQWAQNVRLHREDRLQTQTPAQLVAGGTVAAAWKGGRLGTAK